MHGLMMLSNVVKSMTFLNRGYTSISNLLILSSVTDRFMCCRRWLTVGDKVQISRVITTKDVEAFAELIGDKNPIHLQPDYAKQTKFGRCIVHGAFLTGIVSSVLAMKLPGPGTIAVNQYIEFTAPAYVGEEVTVKVEITSVKRNVVECAYTCEATANQQIVMKGYAKLYVTKVTNPAEES